MTYYMQAIISFMESHTAMAVAIVFLIAFGEAVFILGLFVPSTPVLVGAGTLIAAGILPFAPVFAAASLGAISGDAVSYWLGKTFGAQIRQIWPFNRYSSAMDKGELYFLRHGGKSVFFGRFIPVLKAVIPGVAGIAGMNTMRFTAINVISAFAWSIAHLLPGMGIGFGVEELLASQQLPFLPVLIAGAALLAVLAMLWVSLRRRAARTGDAQR